MPDGRKKSYVKLCNSDNGGVDKTRNTEHSGTCRNIPEHEKIKIIFMKKKIDKIIIQTLTTRDCKGPQTNMPKNAGSIKT